MSRKSLPDFNSYDHFYNSWCCFAEMKNTWIKVFAVELLTNNIKDRPEKTLAAFRTWRPCQMRFL